MGEGTRYVKKVFPFHFARFLTVIGVRSNRLLSFSSLFFLPSHVFQKDFSSKMSSVQPGYLVNDITVCISDWLHVMVSELLFRTRCASDLTSNLPTDELIIANAFPLFCSLLSSPLYAPVARAFTAFTEAFQLPCPRPPRRCFLDGLDPR